MMEKSDLNRVEDMVAAAERSVRHLAGLDAVGLAADELRRDAVVRALEIVGEACKHVSQPTRDRFPHVPWRLMAGMRDRLIHGYDDVNWLRVWETVTLHIPPSLTGLRAVLAALSAEQPPLPEAPS